MKRSLLILTTLPFLAACSSWDDLISRDLVDPALPGIQTQIDCNPEPTLIYSKAGDLIDRIVPVLHPSCTGQVLGETVELASPWWGFFGPPRSRASFFPTESLNDDDPVPRTVATDTPTAAVVPEPVVTPEPTVKPDPTVVPERPVEPEQPVEPEVPVVPEPEPEPPVEPKEPEGRCGGEPDCEPDSKTEPEAYKKWREEAKELQPDDS